MNAKNAVKKRLGTQGTALLQRDIYRLFRTPLLYLFMLCAAVIPGSMSVMTGFEPGYDAWGQVSGLFSAGIFAIAGVFLAFFIGNDYKSGAVKNIFSLFPKKRGYAAAKLITGEVAGIMILAGYVLGAAVFGVFTGADFTSGLFDMLCAVIAKAGMMFLFSGIYVCVAALFRNKVWFSVFGILAATMLFIPALLITLGTPLIMAGLSIAAGVIGLFVFPGIAALIMNKLDALA